MAELHERDRQREWITPTQGVFHTAAAPTGAMTYTSANLGLSNPTNFTTT